MNTHQLIKKIHNSKNEKSGSAKIRKPAWILVETRGIEPLTS